MKVRVLYTCPECKGQAYLPVGEAEDSRGEKYIRHLPCFRCDGSGQAPQWVALQVFITLLQQVQCPHQHTSILGVMHFSTGDVWDDIEEVCDDCGSNLD